MGISTYSDLVASVRAHLVGHDLGIDDTVIASFIGLAEADFGRNLRLREGLGKAICTVAGGIATLPNDFGELQRVTLRTPPRLALPVISILSGVVTISADDPTLAPVLIPGSPDVTLHPVTFDEAASIKECALWRPSPSHYSIVGREVEVVPAPALDTSVLEILYYRRPVALSPTNPTNWLLYAASDLYLYTTLAAAAHWLADPQRAGIWRAEAERIKSELTLDTMTASVGGSPLRMRPRRRF